MVRGVIRYYGKILATNSRLSILHNDFIILPDNKKFFHLIFVLNYVLNYRKLSLILISLNPFQSDCVCSEFYTEDNSIYDSREIFQIRFWLFFMNNYRDIGIQLVDNLNDQKKNCIWYDEVDSQKKKNEI